MSQGFATTSRNNHCGYHSYNEVYGRGASPTHINFKSPNYKSTNNIRYLEKTLNRPTIELSQTNMKEKLQIYQQ